MGLTARAQRDMLFLGPSCVPLLSLAQTSPAPLDALLRRQFPPRWLPTLPAVGRLLSTQLPADGVACVFLFFFSYLALGFFLLPKSNPFLPIFLPKR